MRVAVLTLGCKANQAESYFIESGLRGSGTTIVELSENPDICIINTCSVTAKSDYQSRQLIRRAARSGAKVVVTGCYSELNREKVLSMSGVIKIIENEKKEEILYDLAGIGHDIPISYGYSGRSRFSLKVQDGCNNACTYCVIPSARGRSRSVDIGSILRKVREIEGDFHEIVLTGIHLGTYGYDLEPKATLADLLRALLGTNISRIRLSSIEITEIDDELLDIIEDRRICKHLHVPLQSGDGGILKAMNRGYDSQGFLSGVEKIFKRMPDLALGTDVIVGFPGEGEREFKETLYVLDTIPLSYIHIFPFSPRPGTVAARMENKVDPGAVRERCLRVQELGRIKKRQFMSAQIGKVLDLLIEDADPDGSFRGTTGNYLKVRTVGSRGSLKAIVDVRIVGLADDILVGIPLHVV